MNEKAAHHDHVVPEPRTHRTQIRRHPEQAVPEWVEQAKTRSGGPMGPTDDDETAPVEPSFGPFSPTRHDQRRTLQFPESKLL
jgi:hypothetical protein